MKNSSICLYIVIVAGCLSATILPSLAQAQGAAFCPCNYASATRLRSLTGNEMGCASEDVDVAFVPPHGVTNKQNRFIVNDRNRKGDIKSTLRFFLHEQGLLPAADFGDVVRYGATCSVVKASKSRVRWLDAAYIQTGEEYAECAKDLTALIESVVGTASNGPVTSCDDQTDNGIVDTWEPMNPITTHYCYGDSGTPIQCPELP